MIHFVSVTLKDSYPDGKANGILSDVREFLQISGVEDLKITKKYYLEGINEEDAKKMAASLLGEDVWQHAAVNEDFHDDANFKREVAYIPGMMNPEVQVIMDVAHEMGIENLVALDTAYEYAFYGDNLTEKEVDTIVDRLIRNKTIETIRTEVPETLVIEGTPPAIEIVPIRDMNDEELMALSHDRLFLNLEEMHIIQKYFKKIDRDPTDGEVEMLAQTWSEHCVHKTFKAKLIINGEEKKPLFKRLKESTDRIGHEMVLSAYVDNSGVIDFYDGYAVCGKVETHNSPSAIEPYGGAATGSGGVFRDIVGTGRGAKVIASTDIFCVGPPDINEETIPGGCLHPRYILKRIVAGVRDYGNRMGIPTNNGSVHFHENFRAKPTVIVGAYGLMKKEDAVKGSPKPGDLIVSIGGKTGRDGIHGATFSSGAMHESTNQVHGAAVQIGNAIEEKRAFDAILEMTDQKLLRALTDCGAGGFSSAVGEIAEEVGARVQLEEAPLKYTGLAPWEIWVSESQERMVLAVPEKNIDEVMDIAKKYHVEAKIIGMFTGDKRLHVTYKDQDLINLEMEFIHDGLPQRVMHGKWEAPQLEEASVEKPEDLGDAMMDVMAHLNVASKEGIYRQYDHNVQGTSVVAPYSGSTFKSPTDGAVMEPVLGSGHGFVIGHGLNPVLNSIDPYYGSLWAIFEAVANVVAVGANPERIALIDNFIWPVPNKKWLGALDMSIDACTNAADELMMPFISGKDSLSSTYKSKSGEVIEIPPVLCVSAFGCIDDVNRTCTSSFKKAGNKIITVGTATDEMAGSAYLDTHGELGANIPKADIPTVRSQLFAVAHAINQGLVEACHDISEGGLATAVTEMTFGEKLGANIDLSAVPYKGEAGRADYIAFNEASGRFVMEITPENFSAVAELFEDIEWAEIGEVTEDAEVKLNYDGYTIADKGSDELREAWESPLRNVFGKF